MTTPLTPAGCDLRDFPHTPLFRARLFGSSFHARSTDAEWRAGITLWLKSWDQVPAGSLPNDDIELCRLAELARDVKTWRKVKEGALRGWLLCDDGRLYHPVVAEGVNNAIEKKTAQRAKTAKARIAALEKRLKECKTDADRAHVTDEIRKIKQGLSQTAKESVTDPVTGSKGEGREGEGISNSEPIGSGGEPPDPKDVVFALGVTLLTAAGVADKNARSFLAMQCKQHGDLAVAKALEACASAKAIQPIPWLQEHLKPGKSNGLNRQEAQEQRNRTVAELWADEETR